MRSIQVLERADTGLFHFVSSEWSRQLEQERSGRFQDAVDISLGEITSEEELCSALSLALGLPNYSSWGPVIDRIEDLSEEKSEFMMFFWRSNNSNVSLQNTAVEMLSCTCRFWMEKEKLFHVVFVDNG